MFGSKLKVSKELLEKVVAAAEASGAESPEQFAEDVLDRECEQVFARFKKKSGKPELSDDEVDDIAKKLQGLGYLD